MLNKKRPQFGQTGRLDRFVLRNYAPTVEDLDFYYQRVENPTHLPFKSKIGQEESGDFPDQTQALVDAILTNHIIATELSNEVFQGL